MLIITGESGELDVSYPTQATSRAAHVDMLMLICALLVVLVAITRKVHSAPGQSIIVRRKSSKTWLHSDPEFASACSAICYIVGRLECAAFAFTKKAKL